MTPVGLEPTTHALKVRCSSQLNYEVIKRVMDQLRCKVRKSDFCCVVLHLSPTHYPLVICYPISSLASTFSPALTGKPDSMKRVDQR